MFGIYARNVIAGQGRYDLDNSTDVVHFDVKKKERMLILAIAARACPDTPDARQNTEMDLCAVIRQGQKLDLEKLAGFDSINFNHDIK